MPNARTRTTAPAPADARTTALDALMAHAETLPTSAAIADFLGVSGKTVRGRVRAGTLKNHDGSTDAVAPVRVSKDGQSALTPAHKRSIVYTFAPADADACVKLAATIGK